MSGRPAARVAKSLLATSGYWGDLPEESGSPRQCVDCVTSSIHSLKTVMACSKLWQISASLTGEFQDSHHSAVCLNCVIRCPSAIHLCLVYMNLLIQGCNQDI